MINYKNCDFKRAKQLLFSKLLLFELSESTTQQFVNFKVLNSAKKYSNFLKLL